MDGWKFLSNHAQVLLCIAADPDVRLRDIAGSLDITERTTHRIVSELVQDGYLARERTGRRNRYTLLDDLPLRDPMLRERKVADLVKLLRSVDR